MRLILSIDALHLPLTGIGWYALELARGFAVHPQVEQLVFTDGRRYPLPPPDFAAFDIGQAGSDKAAPDGPVAVSRKAHLLRPIRAAAGRLIASRTRARLEKLEDFVCHGPNYVVPRRGPRERNAVTIHDLSVLCFPDLHPAQRVRYMQIQMPKAIANSRQVIVSSRSVANEVREAYGVADDRVSVVPLGVRSVFSEITQPSDVDYLGSIGVQEGSFFLFVNGADPRKNLSSALLAFAHDKRRQRDGLRMVVTAPMRDYDQLVRSLAGQSNIIVVPYPSESELAILYRGACGLLFPSLYEGFGLPVVEALASGTPALISQADTLLEFAELPGVVAVDVSDTEAFSDGIDQLLSSRICDAALAGAQPISHRFSWQQCVNKTFSSYSELL